MNRIKRWTTTIVSRIDGALGRIENREALVEVGLRDLARAAAKARVQANRLRAEGESLAERRAAARAAARQWRRRAAGAAVAGDEERGVECLRRARRAEADAAELAGRCERHQEEQARLDRDVAAVEKRLEELRGRRDLLRGRQSRAEAMALVEETDGVARSGLTDLFESWEVRVAELEVGFSSATRHDPLAEEYASAEEEADLRRELAELNAPRGQDEPAAEEHSGEEASS